MNNEPLRPDPDRLLEQTAPSLTNALDDESVIERLAHTTSVDEVLELLAGRK